jgi:glycerophosphoryl diester phosphodiesterase
MTTKLWLMHRGVWRATGVENTLSAFDRTLTRLSSTCHGFECDFQQIDVADPQSWVIFHDDTMQRLGHRPASGIDPKVPITQNGYTDYMPTLPAFLTWLKRVTVACTLNLEIKSGTEAGIRYLMDQVQVHQPALVQIIYSSFSPSIMRYLCDDPRAVVAGLMDGETPLSTDINTERLVGLSMPYWYYLAHARHHWEASCPMGVYLDSLTAYQTAQTDLATDPRIGIVFAEA